MLDQLKSMAIFASIVDEGSFRGAARKLKLSPSIVSLHIKNLEQQIGAPLLYRSTRSLSVTSDGQMLYTAAKAMIASARDGLDAFAGGAGAHLTELRIAIPDTLTSNPVFSKIIGFAKNHTGIRLTLISSDVRSNLLDEGHDLAIQMGRLGNSELKSKKIGEDRRITVASPSYLAKISKIAHPNDLKDLDFIGFSAVPEGLQLRKSGSKVKTYWGKTAITADSIRTVRKLAVQGFGISAMPYHEVELDLEENRLVQVLPDWTDISLGIYIVWPRNADLSLATREFINYLSAK